MVNVYLVQVAEHVRVRFCTKEWMDSQLNKTVNEIVVVYASNEEVHCTRPQPDHEYGSTPTPM